MSEEVVRRLSLTFGETGADATTAKFNKLTDASNNLATVTDTNAKRALSAEAAFAKLNSQIDDTARSQAAIERGTRTLNAALAQGVITQEKYNESLGLLKEKYSDANDAGENASEGFRSTGIEAASVANHIKQAAAAAYALSPAFRALVNPAIAAGFSATGTALAAMSPWAAALAVNLASRVLPLLAQVASFALPFALLNAEIKLIGYAWSSAGEQIEKYNNLATQNKGTGVDADFFQRMAKGGDAAKTSIDAVTASLKKFKEVSDEKLGGSTLQNKIDQHIDAGNLDTNSGVEKYSNAVGSEEKYRAIVLLLKQMTDEGRQLAALDIASTFASSTELEAFRQFPGYFQDVLEKADAISQTKLVSSQDIADAVELKNRYDESVRILSERWIPFQETITNGGMALQRIWVSIVESIAAAVNSIAKIGDAIASIKIPSWISTAGGVAAGLVYRAVTPLPIQGVAAAANALSAPSPSSAYPGEYQPTGKYTGTARPDRSNDLRKEAVAQQGVNDAVDRAINSTQKHVLQQEADAKAVSLGASALATFRVEASETAAVLANGGKETDLQKEAFARLKVEAGAAADALAKAHVASEISRGGQLLFASQQDVQIANQLRGIYGDDIPAALASSEAAALRMNANIKSSIDTLRSTLASGVTDFISGLVKGKSVMESLGAAARNISASLTSTAVTKLFSGDFLGAGLAGIGAVVTGIFGASQAEDEENQKRAQAAADAAKKAIEDAAQRTKQYNALADGAGFNVDTVAGQIAQFDAQAMQTRADEAEKGNGAVIALERSLAKQRQAIVDKSNQAIAKSMNDFLNSIKTGANSILSPEDQLKYAQSRFNADVTAGRGGDEAALNRVTADAQNLLDIAKGFYASSSGYATIYQSVTDAITGLAGASNIQVAALAPNTAKTPETFTDVKARFFAGTEGFANGGIVGNGKYGVDSVLAKFSGGGNIALAGGEHVTRASSVNGATRGALDFINRTGRSPGSDNSEIARILTQGFNGQTAVLSDKLETLIDRVVKLENTTRQTNNQRRVPGSQRIAA